MPEVARTFNNFCMSNVTVAWRISMALFIPPGNFWRAIFTRRHFFQILVWPAFCAVAATVLWILVFSTLDDDRNQIEHNMLNQAGALSTAVAAGVSLSVLHMDELCKSLQAQSEHGRVSSAKVRELAVGTALNSQWLVLAGITDRHGHLIAASTSAAIPSLAEQDYFLFHENQLERGLHITRQQRSVITGEPEIAFTRRIDDRDGRFNGVVVVSARPAYLTSFYDERTFGKRGYLGVRGFNGELYAATMGGSPVATPLLDVPPGADTKNGSRLLVNREWLARDEKGLVAWQSVAPFPLFVVIGLAEREALLHYSVMADTYLAGAKAASWFLLVCAVTGTLAMMLLVWRQQQAQETRDAYRLATESAHEGFFFFRALYDEAGQIVDFVIEDCNQTGAALGGVTRDQLIGVRLSALPEITDFIVPADLPSQIAVGTKAMAAGIYEDEWSAASVSSFRGLCLHRKMVRFGNGLAITLRDISAAKAHEKSLLAMAHEDALTKLPNRHWLMTFLPGAIERARQSAVQLALFFIDIDNFKQVNDTLGHAAGDALLHIAAMRLKSELRPGDSLARLGGDEFTIVLEAIVDRRDAQLVAERIVESFKYPVELSNGKALIGSSIGISLYPTDGQDTDTLLRYADIAMYAAKSAGKGRYCFYETHQYQTLLNRITSQEALENAVLRDQFVMHYQPRLNCASGQICGIEALVRWQCPERGLLAPAEFIPLAETTGLILLLGKMVMEKVCAQIEQWGKMKLPMVPVSFNVSASEFNLGDVRSELALCIERHHIQPAALEIELTETMLVDGKSDAVNAMTALRGMGVKCLVDDFGTGFSSLSQLQRFDTDVLKIDQSFTSELGRTGKGETFIRAIISMAHALGMGVVAEGVETIEQLHLLQTLGCEEVQGFYMCPPVPALRMASLLNQRFMMTPDGVLL